MRRPYVFITIATLLITKVHCENIITADENPVVQELTDDRTTLIWTATDPTSILVTAEPGYQIEVKAKEINLNGAIGNYVTVKSVTDDGDGDALMFTYSVNGNPTYLYNNNKLQADYDGVNENDRFVIEFTRVGEALTTTPKPESSTTTEAMPTPSPDEQNDAILTVYLKSISINGFNDARLRELKGAIANMGVQYCTIENCPLNESISLGHVKIHLLAQCPIQWENYEDCVKLSFALPIVKSSNSTDQRWDGYQLNQGHLKRMWDDYAKEQLAKIHLEEYTVPDVDKMFNNRLLISCLVIFLLLILILIARHLMAKINKKRRRLSDTISIVSQQSKRNSQLTPHYLQELPPLFTNDFPIYAEKRSHKGYSDFNNVFSDDIEPNVRSSSPNTLNIAGQREQEDSEVEA